MVLPICIYGDAVLRAEANAITTVTPELRALAENMIETMHGADGVGLAAPQVGHSERLFVVDISPMLEREGRQEEAVPPQPMVFLNPEITWESEEEVTFEEGCLSIPDVREKVWRPERIRLRYRDLEFVEHELDASPLLSRVIQHELDHLDGVLFLDHITPFRRRMLQRRLRAMAQGDVTADYPIHVAG